MPFGKTAPSSMTSSPSPDPRSRAKIRPGSEFFAGSESPRGSVNHSLPSGPKARSFGPSRRTPPTSVATDRDGTVGRDALDAGGRPTALAHPAVLRDVQRAVGRGGGPVRPAAGGGDALHAAHRTSSASTWPPRISVNQIAPSSHTGPSGNSRPSAMISPSMGRTLGSRPEALEHGGRFGCQLVARALDGDRHVARAKTSRLDRRSDGAAGQVGELLARQGEHEPADAGPVLRRRRTSRSSRTTCTASPTRSSGVRCCDAQAARASSGWPVMSPLPTVFISSRSTAPSAPTSSEPNGSLPVARASRASSRQRRRWATSTWSTTGLYEVCRIRRLRRRRGRG